MQIPTSMGQRLRAIGARDRPASICHALVSKDGTIKIAAASTGGITMARSPIEMVGKPSPITPFATPARANIAPTKMNLKSIMCVIVVG
jgi:hypothetical protein